MYKQTPAALSASQYYTKSAYDDGDGATVLRVTKSRVERRLQLSMNAAYTLGICACVLSFGMLVIGVFNLVVRGQLADLAIALWGGMLGAAAVGGSAVWTFRDEPLRRERIKTTFTLGILAMVFHLATLAMGGLAADQEHITFHDQLFVACDRDPSIYHYDLAYAQQLSANRNPNNPAYKKNCDSRYPDAYCNIDPDKLASQFNPDEWWQRNKYKVYDLYQFYRNTFRFSYGLDIVQVVLAIQLVGIEIFLLICCSFVLSHKSEFRAAIVNEPLISQQRAPASSNANPRATVPPVSTANLSRVTAAPQPNPQQLISPAFMPTAVTTPSESSTALSSNNEQIYANVKQTQQAPAAPPSYSSSEMRKSTASLGTALSASKPQPVRIEFVDEPPPPPPSLKKLNASRERLSHAGNANTNVPQRNAAAPPLPPHALPRHATSTPGVHQGSKRATTQI